MGKIKLKIVRNLYEKLRKIVHEWNGKGILAVLK